ncbi:uncharacterized protein PADG_11627 [Paracoccidioides brasiliensis Pb18]|uniref:Uncharacterized protein n=1 Tax=Paracoccidioides brasiliensis (strain Pb18) TaxID=502780 RepID=A0A0A0HTY2_PARBD|nr:uncharacterized protein PADG_11627 [Paracoccidioides brasiliensis Pb18]KGM92097.1 hypothetical protein PADG_11627 [Paracoccidioides brasiliensis Pb18]
MSHDLTSRCDGATAHYSTVKGRLKFGPKSLGHQPGKVAGPQHRSTVPRLPLNNQLAKTTSDQIASEKSVLSPPPAQVDSSASGQCGHLSLFAMRQRRLLQPVWQLIVAQRKNTAGWSVSPKMNVVAKLFWTGGAPDLIQRKIKDNCT